MRTFRIFLSFLLLLAIAATGCGGPREIGSPELLDFDEREQQRRLGERQQPPPADAPAEEEPREVSAPPGTQPPPPPPESERFFEVTLVAESPYFEPGNQMLMSMSLTLRVTNNDTTAERPTRSFTAEDGSFDSGPMRLGESWTHKFSGAATYRIIDQQAPFIFASLEVR